MHTDDATELSLLTLNCEGHKHLDKIIPFLEKQRPDVICLQEVFGQDMALFEEKLGKKAFFAPIVRITEPNRYGIDLLGAWGVAILTDLEVAHNQIKYYKGQAEHIPEFEDGNPNSCNRAVVALEVVKNGVPFSLGTTHFTWSPGGESTEEQYRDLNQLFTLTNDFHDLVLSGDFNAPRGRGIYHKLAEHFTDNIPSNVTTTLDETLHYAGKLDLVVDYIFTTPQYVVKNVKIHNRVSDHMAVSATVMKR